MFQLKSIYSNGTRECKKNVSPFMETIQVSLKPEKNWDHDVLVNFKKKIKVMFYE